MSGSVTETEDRIDDPHPVDEALLDPAEAARRSEARRQRLYTFQVPALRCFGMVWLVAAVAVYNQFFEDAGSARHSLGFALIATTYAAVAWPVLSWSWTRWPVVERLLLVLDVFFFVGAIYATGGERSWMLTLLLMRAADQAPYGTRRAAWFSTICVAAYLGMIAWLDFGEGRTIAWGTEAAKALLLLMAGTYIALTAQAFDAQRQRTQRAIATSRRLLEHLGLARDQAQAADQAKSRFLANMSHEIRTPLAAVVGISDLMVAEDLTEAQRKKADMLRSSASSLLGVIDEVLDYSKIEAGYLELQPHDLSVLDLVRDAVLPFEPKAGARGVTIEAEVEDGLAIHADGARLRQILVNLVGNALKHTRDGTIRILVERTSEKWTTWRVLDTGEGFGVDAPEELFAPFSQADDTASRRHEGVGLGLAICRSLLDVMGGSISAHPRTGGGAELRFEIPFVPTASAATGTAPGAADASPTELRSSLRGLVLLVEDNEVNRLVSREVLLALGLEVDEANDGVEAVEKVAGSLAGAARSFDLILMDCQMPRMDGYEATAEIRRFERERRASGGDGYRLPILALTAHAFEADRRRCEEAGMDGYLTKPVRISTLGQQIGRWLRQDS